MRIIAGEARSRVIQAPQGKDTRPTLDRVRENLFNVLQNKVPYAHVLDLFGGSGALALEAISRGAAHAVCVDHDRKAIQCIQQNMRTLRFDDRMKVMHCDWRSALTQLKAEGVKFDLVFLDPPYAMHDLSEVTQLLLPLLDEGATIVIEHERTTMPSVADGLYLTDQRRYGIVGISIFRLNAEVR